MLPAIIAPVMRSLRVSDPAFYRDVLEFEIRGGPHGAEAVRGPARLAFDPKGASMVFFETGDLDGMRAALAQRGAAPSGIDKINSVKMRVFAVRDPDGNTLWFGQSYNVEFPAPPPPLLEKALPELPCSDVSASVAHYRDILGFHINYRQDDLGVMDRDRVTVLLVARTGRHSGAGSAYFYVADADALHAEFTAKGAAVRGAPVSQPWGLRDFCVADPDGNELRFGQPFE